MYVGTPISTYLNHSLAAQPSQTAALRTHILSIYFHTKFYTHVRAERVEVCRYVHGYVGRKSSAFQASPCAMGSKPFFRLLCETLTQNHLIDFFPIQILYLL
jgi:hypothetical protein